MITLHKARNRKVFATLLVAGFAARCCGEEVLRLKRLPFATQLYQDGFAIQEEMNC